MAMTPFKHRYGFTLLEMSIVIAVIGLIMGGIVMGRSLLKNAQLQSLIADVNQYKQAIKLFKDKYHSLPGDMPNATTLWGDDGGCPAGNATTGQKETCDGDGNNIIGDPASAVLGSATGRGEVTHAFQHLANAELIEGSYSGAAVANAYVAGITIPKSRLGGVYTLSYSTSAATDYQVQAHYGHIIFYGSTVNLAAGATAARPALKGDEARRIDAKIDDGLPLTGNVLTLRTTALAYCASNNSLITSVYRLDQIRPSCSLIFITGF